MANNGIFYSSGNTLNFTTDNTTWATLTSGGTFVINTVSGGTYLNLPASTGSTSGAYLPLSGGTMTGGIVANSGLTANTISATTYYNLPTDVFVTGGTYTSGNAIFTNNTGGTFTVTGFAIGGGGGQLFYLNLSQSQGSNRLLSTTGSTASQQTTGVTINNGVTGSIASFQSQPLNITLLPGGIWSFYLHSYKQNTNASFDIFVEVYKRTSGGTQTLLFSTDPTPVTTNSPNPSMQLSDSYFSGTTLLVSDSIVATVRATNTGNQSHTITLVTEGSTHYSYVVSTIPTQQGLTCDTLSGCTIIQTIQTDLTNKLDKSGGTISGGLVVNSGLTATTISATTYQNLPQSVSGTGTQDYLTKWDPSLVGIVDSTIYDNGGFVGINTTSPSYGEAVSIQTANKGVLIDDAYVIQTGNGSLAFAGTYDYSSWGGYGEIAIGSRGPLSNSTGTGNIGIGDKALLQNITGSFNIGIGATMALGNNVGGNSNIGIGTDALLINIEGSNNVSIGKESLRNNTSGSTNIAIGTSAGYSNLNDNGNVYIGDSAGYSNVGGNNIFIGYGAGSGDTSSNNRLNIGNTIFGSLSGKTIGINNLNPITTLDVSGTTRITGGLTASTVSATTYLNLPFSGTVRTSGTTTSNYIPRFTGTTTLTNSSIQDNGTNVGVNTTPSSSYKMSIYSLTNTPLYVQNQASNGTSISVLSNGPNSQTGISAIGYGGASANNTGVMGQAYDGLLAIGVAGGVGITEFGSITTGIGGYFDGIGDGGFGVPINSYSVQLIDGTEGVDKVLISKTSDGKANWSNTLTGLTNVRSTTISATTYQNLPVTQTTYVFNMNSYAVPNGSLFYGVYLGGTPVNPTVVATQYGGTSTDFFPGYPMPAGTASTLTIILRIAQVAPTSAMTLKLANTSTSTFGPVVTIASGSAAGTYTSNSATVGFTTNQRLTIVASNPFVAGATSGPQLTTGSFKYQLS